MRGLQPSASQPEMLGCFPGSRRLAQCSLGGPPGLSALALPDGEPPCGLGGAQSTAVKAVAQQPCGSGAVGRYPSAMGAGAAK
eukprot:11603463-Alexandrium_andersonii.AAC.1